MWVTWVGGRPTVNIGVVGLEDQDSRLLDELGPDGADVRLIPVRYSEQQLQAFGRRSSPSFGRLPMGPCSASGSGRRNEAGVTLDVEDQALVRELETLVPAEALHIEVSPGLRAEAL